MQVSSRRLVLPLMLSAMLVSGCSEDSQTPDGKSCPAVSGAAVEHQGLVTTSETWAAGSTHVITSNLTLRGQVTVAPCVTVHIAPGASLQVDSGGVLRVEGSKEQPIRFDPDESGRPWGELLIGTGGSARLSWVVFSGGGDPGAALATVRVNAGAELPGPRPLFVQHVTIQNSRGPGIMLNGTAGFAEGSSDLTIRDAGNEARPHPMMVNPNALGTLPTGTYTGNVEDTLFVGPSIASSSVYYLGADATLKDLGVPYRLEGLQVGALNAPAKLTIEAGAELRFEPETMLRVVFANSTLVAAGTAAKPIVFTSALEHPVVGAWAGISFEGLNPESRLESVVVRYAGGPCQCSGFGCNYLPDSFDVSSAILVFQEPAAPFIANARIEYSAGHGILRGWDGAAIDLATSTTFEHIMECTQTTPKDAGGRCPSEPPACPRSP
ncbi:hypothetical protein LXT21_38950 [Myxococcus sp. K38C18041901]|uniref:hypothetical protein n=1 Tax=Myxococcus guangdongensis TaxID=2906760 RepID=UPI0020A6F3CD|nr:hypothetical protein [Myxococcus guangdongensis]MCP3064767.1 hypothetical protein [Myxococcus guangdongensis]